MLYVKTHCHSMHPVYFKPGGPTAPHRDANVRRELGELFDCASAAGMEVRFLSASEAYRAIIESPPPPRRDLARDYGLDSEPPMAAIGLTVAYRDASGEPCDPPPLGAVNAVIAQPSIIDANRPVVAKPTSVVAHIVPLGEERLHADEARAKNHQLLGDASSQAEGWLAAPDVRSINALASAVCLERIDAMGAKASGLTGFYGGRAREGQLLQPSEVLCAEFVRRHLPRAKAAHEIGCGLGLLSLLLSRRGLAAVGYERNGARLATGQAIAAAHGGSAAASAAPLRLLKGVFPKAARREPGLADSVALVTNLLGSASLEQQRAFVAGLAAFGAVVIDVQRFYERRMSEAQIAGLTAMFAASGFSPPKLAFELGSDGRFLLFINPAPREPFGWGAALTRLGLKRRRPLLTER